jgi:hypothetical protein
MNPQSFDQVLYLGDDACIAGLLIDVCTRASDR